MRAVDLNLNMAKIKDNIDTPDTDVVLAKTANSLNRDGPC